MSKDSFNNLSIEEQVKYINLNLTENKSLTKICKEIGIDRSTVRKRFKKFQYTFDKDKNLYLNDVKNITNDKNEKTPYKSRSSKEDEVIIDKVYLNSLERQIEDLSEKYDSIMKLLKQENDSTENDSKFKRFEGDVVNRAYKIDSKVQQSFKAYCKKYSEYRVSDILSTILKEHIEKDK